MALLRESEDTSLIAGVMSFIRTNLGAAAVSLYSSVLSNKLTKCLQEYVTPAATGPGLSAKYLQALFEAISSGVFIRLLGSDVEILVTIGHVVKYTYAMRFETVILCTLPFGFLIRIATVMSSNVEDYLTDDGARKLMERGSLKLRQQIVRRWSIYIVNARTSRSTLG